MPTSRHIAFALITFAAAGRASPQQGATTAPKVLAQLPATLAGGQVAVSPDGKHVLISDTKALYEFSRATGSITKLADGEFDDIDWSGGNRLAFDRTDEKGDTYIWTVAVDQATGKLVGAARRVSLSAGDTPAMSPDGKWIAFAKDEHPGQSVAVVPANGGPERILSRNESGGVNPFGWSADGQWIYYDARVGQGRQFTVNRVTTNGKTELLIDRNVSHPSLSRDGRLLLYRSSADSAAIATVDGRLLATLTIDDPESGVTAVRPQWLPGSNAVVFTMARRGSAVTAVSLADGRSRVLGDSTNRTIFPAISPDGKSVAALTTVGGRVQVSVRPLAGGAARYIRTTDVPTAGPLAWSLDSRFIAVRTGVHVRPGHLGPDAATGCEVIDVASGKAQRLQVVEPVLGIGWRRDGAIRYAHAMLDAEGKSTSIEVRETTLGGSDRLVRDVTYTGGIVPAGQDHVYLVARGELVDLRSGDTRALLPPNEVPQPVAPLGGRPVPVFSPDEQWVAMPVATSGTRPLNAIMVVSVKTGERRTIPLPFRAANTGTSLLWHPDGKHLIVSGMSSGGPGRVFLVPLSAAPSRPITTVDFNMEGLALSISPDGGTLVLARRTVPTAQLVELSLAPLLNAAAHR